MKVKPILSCARLGWRALVSGPRKIKVVKCGGGCVTCVSLKEETLFDNTFNKVTYDIHCNDTNNNTVSCKTGNVVYMLTCNKCNMRYVGETGRSLKCRIKEHIYNLQANSSKNKNSRAKLYKHLKTCGSGFSTQIIELLGALGPNERKIREDFWIKRLKTVYPYGMNDKYKQENNDGTVYSLFKNSTGRDGHIRGRRNNRNNRVNILDTNEFLMKLRSNYKIDPVEVSKTLLNNIWSRNIKQCKEFVDVIDKFYKKSQLDKIIRDFCMYKINCYSKQKGLCNTKDIKSMKNEAHIVVNFVNKAVELIGLGGIFNLDRIVKVYQCDKINNPVIQNKRKSCYSNYFAPTIYYKYSDPVGLKIFNYNKPYVFEKDSNRCLCHMSRYKNYVSEEYGHVLTGDINIINNHKIEALMRKGPKYRPAVEIDFEEAQSSIFNDLDQYVIKACRAGRGNDFSKLITWLEAVKDEIKLKINRVRGVGTQKYNNNDVPYSGDWKCLEKLKKNFVISYVDKCAQNYAIICNKFYNKIITSELNSSTYVPVDATEGHVVARQSEETFLKYDLCCDEYDHIPKIVVVPKFHKNPIKFRSIIASSGAVTEMVSKTLSVIFRLVCSQLKKYYGAIENSSKLKLFWMIDNNKEFLRCCKRLNRKKSLISINAYDFSTLYTMIKHDELITAISELVDLAFHRSDKLRVIIVNDEAFWTSKFHGIDEDMINTFSRNKIKSMVEWLVSNTYFKYGEDVYRQVVGIPMGTSCAPYLANLFLVKYETDYIKNSMAVDYNMCRKIKHIFRLMDDLVVLNDDNVFETVYKKIYPASLELNKTNEDNTAATFLDVRVVIQETGVSEVDIYDKRRDYKFVVNGFPEISGNISGRMCYRVFENELLRYIGVINKPGSLKFNIQRLIDLLEDKNYCRRSLQSITKRFVNKYSLEIIMDDI